MTKQELNSKLREINEKKIANGNGFIMQGTNKVGKDLLPLLQNGEEIVDFCDARISSLFKFFKGTRYARCYLVITTNRFIYIERGNVIMGLNPLAKKTVLIERNSMSGDVVANSGMEKVLYPYLLRISSNSGQYQISVKDDVSPYLQVGSIVNPMEETKVERKVSQEFAEDIKEPSHRFCRYCGKEVEDTWVKCPYCGNILQENRKQGNVEQEKYVNAQTGINGNYVPNNTMLNNQPPKKKKKLPFIIGGVVAAVVLLLVLLFGGSDNPAPQEVVELSSYENGFAGWEASGFEGSVKTDITIPYPLTDTGRNNYAVYIGVGKTNVGIIMQEDESAISEWDWLMDAQPDMETQAYYFNCTLTYANQTAGENNTPVFVIENVQEANDIENVQEDNDIENQQVMAGLDVSMYVGGDVDNLLQADNHLSTDDGEFYVDETENVTVSVIDGNIDMFIIAGETDYPINFAGISVGDSAQNMADTGLVNAGYTYYSQDATGIIYLYSDNMAGVTFVVDENGCIASINWMDNCGEMLGSFEESFVSEATEIVYADEEIEDFAGEYEGGDFVTLYISLGTYYSVSDLEAGEVVGDISISSTMGTMEAQLWKADINEYAIYQEFGNAVIGRMTVIDNAVIITDSSGFDGTYELTMRYES